MLYFFLILHNMNLNIKLFNLNINQKIFLTSGIEIKKKTILKLNLCLLS